MARPLTVAEEVLVKAHLRSVSGETDPPQRSDPPDAPP